MAEKIDRDNYCKDCKRSIYGEYKDCDVNIDNNGYYPCNWECHCKVKTESEVRPLANGDWQYGNATPTVSYSDRTESEDKND